MPAALRILGLDPGLRHTGWGVIEAGGGRLRHVANGAVHSAPGQPLAPRLAELYRGLNVVLARYLPDVAAVEETFVNRNPGSTLKLGHARGVALLAPALAGVPVAEYAPNLVKKTIVGTGHADKPQIAMMVRTLLPAAGPLDPDAADALAVAICHAQHATFAARVAMTAGAAR